MTCVAVQEASKSLHYSLVSLPSCGSRGVKIVSAQRAHQSVTQGKWEYKRLRWVQGTMLEVQQQRGAVIPRTALWSFCPEGSLKFINLGAADQWMAAYQQFYSRRSNEISTKPRAPSLVAACSSSSLQTPQRCGWIAGVVVTSSYLPCFLLCHCAGLLHVLFMAV